MKAALFLSTHTCPAITNNESAEIADSVVEKAGDVADPRRQG